MKIIKLSLLFLLLLVFAGCGNKLAFKPQEPLQNAALVYVYAVENIGDDENTNESDFSIRINKPVMQRIIGGEYMVFNLKPVSLSISATKKEVEEKVLKLDLKALIYII